MKELSARGYEDFRPAHDFAMRAISAGADSASELGRRMSVTKQAAAKTIEALLGRGYVVREADPSDARRKPLHVTSLGREVLTQGEAIFDDLRRAWGAEVGAAELENLEEVLSRLVGDATNRLDAPGCAAGDAPLPATSRQPRLG